MSDDHDHDHGEASDHRHRPRIVASFLNLMGGHGHSHAGSTDAQLDSNERGIRAVKISLVALFVTAALQAGVVLISESVALLSDTVHNLADALTAVPLWIAFSLGRRPPTRRYTYGFGRAEDLAGIFIVLTITASAVVAGVESVGRLIDPKPIDHLPLVVAAAIIGFLGNELVAIYRIRVGRDIGSAALVADGVHARTDGLTSLGVLVGALGVYVGFERADAIAGLLITLAIAGVVVGAARDVYHRLMDAVDPDLVAAIQKSLLSVDGVDAVDDVRIRWIGHRLRAEVQITVDSSLGVVDAHNIAVRAHHSLLHAVPRLGFALVHANPGPVAGVDHHAELAHHHAPT